MNKFFALIDCNNFYVSCERVFQPIYNFKPVVVLSNNDGCVISRSEEAKNLNIAMGAPLFQVQKLCEQNNVKIFSSNYTLYNDMSNRVMSLLKDFSPNLEVYSIDEAFLYLNEMDIGNTDLFMKKIVDQIYKYIGLPVSIGIGSTKTLAKVANFYAKKILKQSAFSLLAEEQTINQILKHIDIQNVWGIGREWAIKLRYANINTAYDFKYTETMYIKKLLNIVGARICEELKGSACLQIEKIKTNKTIMCSRAFGKLVTQLEDLEEAISHYSVRAAQKLRAENSKVKSICVFLRTSYHSKEPYYSSSESFSFESPTQDTCLIISTAKRLIKKLYKPNYKYYKAGIIFTELASGSVEQSSLFLYANENEKIKKDIRDNLVKTLDKVNAKYGRNTLFYAAEGVQRNWQMKSNNRSFNYTTKWNDILMISDPETSSG